MLLSNIALIITCLVTLALGFFVIFQNKRSKINVSFGLFAISVALWIFTNFMAEVSKSDSALIFWNRAAIIPAAFLPYILLYFSTIFPTETKTWSRKLWLLLSLPLCVIIFLTPTSYNIESVELTAQGQNITFGFLYNFLFVYFISYITAALYNLYKRYRKSLGLQKLQLRYLFWSLSISLLFGAVTNLILPVLGSSALVAFGALSPIIFVGFTSYAIVRHRLLDIEVIIRRSLVYSTLLAILIGMYSLLVSVLNRVFLPGTAAGVFPRVTDLIAIVVIAFSVDPLRRFIERATDKIFFKARYDAEEIINNLSETLVNEIDLIQLASAIKKVLVESVKVSKLSIYVKSDRRLFAIAVANDFPKRLDTVMEKLHFVTQYLAKHPDILIMEELERMAKEGKRLDHHLTEAVKSFGEIGVEVVVPLLVKGRLNGVMFLGEKLSQDIYSSADLRFLEILSHQAALSLENAKLYEEQKLYGVRLAKEVETATTDLRHANERLKELDKLKDEFMSIASHELRTPMTAIKSYVWLALNNRGGEVGIKVRNYLTKVYDSSERMIAMINDMLNVSRIETGRLQLELVPTSIQKVLDQVTGDLSARAGEAEVEIKVAKDKIVPLVLTDREKLAEVFTNLIGNALKFTPKGGTVTISSQKKGDMVETNVTDTGVGISEENIPKLFKKYGKIGESYATMSPSTGTGLGLYITKQYLEKMQGAISVKSTIGKGTTFTFSLPIAVGVTKEVEEKKEVVAFVPKSIIK